MGKRASVTSLPGYTDTVVHLADVVEGWLLREDPDVHRLMFRTELHAAGLLTTLVRRPGALLSEPGDGQV